MNFREINPGICKLVAMLQDHGFDTCDSGDGITNPQLKIDGAMEIPNVFMTVPPAAIVSESKRLLDLLCSRVDFESESSVASIEASYSPLDDTAVIALTGIDDGYVFGRDNDEPRKRLEYQIRFIIAWLTGDREPNDRDFYVELLEKLKNQLASMPPDVVPF